jgi:acetyl-CoA acetyltransferase
MVSLVSFLDENARRQPDQLACAGGLLARDHPLGETGVAQVVEVTRHLAGRTGSLGHRWTPG